MAIDYISLISYYLITKHIRNKEIMEEIRVSVGDNIKRIAKLKKMTIYQVMKKSEVSAAYLYDLTNNRQGNPSIEILKKISAALEVPIEELIN